MQFRTCAMALVATTCLFASADKKLPLEKNSNEFVEISATLLSKDEIMKEFGSNLGGNVLVMRATVRPLTEKPVRIDYDDFFLLDTNSGQRAEPFEPSQIAGRSVLVVTPTGVRGGGMMGQSGPMWGGIPGMGPAGGGVGNATSDATENSKVEVQKDKDQKPNPLLDALKAKALPEKETPDTITGFLYFPMEGKVKAKDLEMTYKSPSGRIIMRFKQ